ncbi:MAG: molybdopterin-synthase adenylyltransferase MoeB [Deltaproteobacteria bacterium]|nr:molybdopterin-synthase adenylyltransferase MoeB [Deltaproteobacteria bacterium]
MNFEEYLQSLKKTVAEVSPKESKNKVIIDVRDVENYNEAHIPGAVNIPRGLLELKIEKIIPDKTTPIVCQCGGGTCSLLSAHSLQLLGYTNVSSMAGGFKKWKEECLPMETAQAILTPKEKTFYERHLSLPEVGAEGQLKLKKAKVLIVGAGGLGSPSAFYLAAAGVGTLGLVDFDIVDASNLHRQILHTYEQIGKLKVESAKETLLGLNPNIKVETYPVKLAAENAKEIFESYDVIIDGSDNFTTRYLINDVCVALKKPNIHGSIYRFEGQLSVFWQGHGPCYRCLFPEPPPKESAPSCAEAGVLGVLPGIIGTLQAVETIKWILEKGDLLTGRLLCYDALQTKFKEIKIKRDPNCPCCS